MRIVLHGHIRNYIVSESDAFDVAGYVQPSEGTLSAFDGCEVNFTNALLSTIVNSDLKSFDRDVSKSSTELQGT